MSDVSKNKEGMFISSVPAIAWTVFYTDLYYQEILKMCKEGKNENEILELIGDKEAIRIGYASDDVFKYWSNERFNGAQSPLSLFCKWVYHSYKYSSAVNALSDFPPQIKTKEG